MRVPVAGSVVAVLVAGIGAIPASPAFAAVPSGSNASSVLARMTVAQRVGQLVMVSAALSGVTQASKEAITRYHVGSVFLSGRSSAGVTSVRSMTNKLRALATPAET